MKKPDRVVTPAKPLLADQLAHIVGGTGSGGEQKPYYSIVAPRDPQS